MGKRIRISGIGIALAAGLVLWGCSSLERETESRETGRTVVSSVGNVHTRKTVVSSQRKDSSQEEESEREEKNSSQALQEEGFFLNINGEESDIYISLADSTCIYEKGGAAIYSYEAYRLGADYYDYTGSNYVLYLVTPEDGWQIFPVSSFHLNEEQGFLVVEIWEEGRFASVQALQLMKEGNTFSWQQTELFDEKKVWQLWEEVCFPMEDKGKALIDVTFEKGEADSPTVRGYVSVDDSQTHYGDWEINLNTNEMDIFPCVLRVYDEKTDQDIFSACSEAYDRIEQGDWSKVIAYKEVNVEIMEKQTDLLWYRQDVNRDNLPELIMFNEQGEMPEKRSKVAIENVFTYREDGWIEQVEMDQVDVTEFSFVGTEGTLIYDVDNYGITAWQIFEQYVYDIKWNKERLLIIGLEGFESEEYYAEYTDEDMVKELKESYPESFGKSGGGVYAFMQRRKTGEELTGSLDEDKWIKEYISLEEFYRLYEEMTGSAFLEENTDWEGWLKQGEEENKGYELFLTGKEKVVIGEEFQEDYKKLGLEVENQASIDEMIEMIQMTYLTGKFTESDHKLSEIQYGFLDCGGDGKEELILRFIGLDIYAYEDNSALTYVIRRNQDGVLILCDESLSWARKSVDYYYHGFIYEYGSSGAGDHTARVSVVDSLGKKHDIYETRYVIGSWLPFWGKNFDDFWESESEATLELQNYHIGGKDYYSYVIMDGADEKKCEQYLQHCRENGITFYTAEEIEKLIEEHYNTLGIPVEYFSQMEIQWNTLKLD